MLFHKLKYIYIKTCAWASMCFLPSSMSSSVLLCPSAIATFPLMTGFWGILGGSSGSPAEEKNICQNWKFPCQLVSSNNISCYLTLIMVPQIHCATSKQMH